ncbi:MAG: Gfo/Idh/MocA family protein [bacterium]
MRGEAGDNRSPGASSLPVTSRLRVAVVGCGIQAQVALIPALKSNPNVELTALCDKDVRKLRQLVSLHGVKRYYTDFDRLKEDAGVQAIVVATPNYLHAPMAIAAMEYGKDVLCEMPLALNYQEAKEMVAAADRTQRRLMPCLVTRLRPDVQMVKRFVDGKELGRVYFCKTGWLRGREAWSPTGWWYEPHRAGGGAFLTLGSALLDSALWVLKPAKPVRVYGVAAKRNTGAAVEDTAFALVRFDTDVVLTVEVGWSLLMERDFIYFNLFGTSGAALLNPITINKEMHGRLVNITPQIPSRGLLRAAYQRLIEFWVDSLLQDIAPSETVADALTIAQITDGFYRSNTQGGEVELREGVATSAGS